MVDPALLGLIKSEARLFQFQLDSRFDFRFLRNKRETVTGVVQDTAAATGANYGVFWIAPYGGVVERVWETHKTAGTNAGTVTVDVEILGSGVALDSGKAVLSSALSLKTTADIPQEGSLSPTISNLQFAEGDRLALKDSGTLTSVAHVAVTVVVRRKT